MRGRTAVPVRPLLFDSWVAFDPAFAQPAQDGPCVLDGVPPDVVHVHRPALVNELDRRLAHLVQHPVQTRILTPQCRLVSVMGSKVYAIGPDTRVVANAWSTDPALQGGDLWRALHPCHDRYTPVVDLPAQNDWLHPFQNGLIRTLQAEAQLRVESVYECGSRNRYALWVAARMEKRHWKPATWRAVRAAVAAALALDPAVVRIARRIHLNTYWASRVSVETYNHVLEHRQDYVKLQRENPQLVALFALLHRDLDGQGEPAERIRARVITHGISPAMWRWVHRYGTPWLPDLCRRQKALPVLQTLDLLHAMQRFGWKGRAPRDIVEGVIGRVGDAGIEADSEYRRTGRVEPAMRAMVRWWENGSPKDRATLKTELLSLMMWLARGARKTVTPREWTQMTLKGAMRRIFLWHERDLLEDFGTTSWEPRFSLPPEVAGWSPVQLTSTLQVWEEGQAMHHCVFQHAGQCLTGEIEIISLRQAQTGRRVATLGFKVEGQALTAFESAGVANAPVTDAVRALSRDLAEQMGRQLALRMLFADAHVMQEPPPRARLDFRFDATGTHGRATLALRVSVTLLDGSGQDAGSPTELTAWFRSPYGLFQELGRWLECAERSDSPPEWCWSIDREQVGALSLSLSLSLSGSASPSLSLPTSVFRLHWAGCDHAFAVDRSRLISDLRRAVFDHDNPYGER